MGAGAGAGAGAGVGCTTGSIVACPARSWPSSSGSGSGAGSGAGLEPAGPSECGEELAGPRSAIWTHLAELPSPKSTLTRFPVVLFSIVPFAPVEWTRTSAPCVAALSSSGGPVAPPLFGRGRCGFSVSCLLQTNRRLMVLQLYS